MAAIILPDGLAVQRRVGDLRSDVTVQADQFQRWLVQDALHGRGGATACEGEAELLVVDTGRHRGVAVDVDARRVTLISTRCGRRASQAR